MNGELPPTIARIAELIGLQAALRLVEKFGGTRIYIPEELPTPDHVLAKTIGYGEANALCAAFARDWLSVPRCTDRLRAQRDNQIRQEYDGGRSVRELAREYEMTERNIWRIVASDDKPVAVPVDPRQRSLF